MLDWLTWPANLLLNTAAVIESCLLARARLTSGSFRCARGVTASGCRGPDCILAMVGSMGRCILAVALENSGEETWYFSH